MNEYNKKDALTDLVQNISSTPQEPTTPSNNGTVSSPSGETVELGYRGENNRSTEGRSR